MSRLLLVLLVLLLAACSSDRKVGGACGDDGECADRCLENYPGGMCTITCRADDECPSGTICADTEGGVCLFPCDSNQDCRDQGLEAGYACDGETSFDNREIRVCVDSG